VKTVWEGLRGEQSHTDG